MQFFVARRVIPSRHDGMIPVRRNRTVSRRGILQELVLGYPWGKVEALRDRYDSLAQHVEGF